MSTGTELRAQIALPGVRIGIWVVEASPPDAIVVLVFLPIGFWIQGGISIGATTSSSSRAFSPFEGQGFHEIKAGSTAEAGGAGIARRHFRVRGKKVSLGSRP